ncbi:hypothetical protein SAMN05216605_106295 [Pseudomonas abietaniphila]|uniref:Uncharacterized protein n=1 Tax=Pseudomonas abietaniphila TaxID=89065 RepID=A0A1G8CNH5_9PSED|nr:hypothetical protein SAMN05216605_106295 [Pseudomonas abietaniphila]
MLTDADYCGSEFIRDAIVQPPPFLAPEKSFANEFAPTGFLYDEPTLTIIQPN